MRRAVPLSLCVCLIALSSTIPHAQNTPKPPAGYTRATADGTAPSRTFCRSATSSSIDW